MSGLVHFVLSCRGLRFWKRPNPSDATSELKYCIVVLYNWANAFKASGERYLPSGDASYVWEVFSFFGQISGCWYLLHPKNHKYISFHKSILPNCNIHAHPNKDLREHIYYSDENCIKASQKGFQTRPRHPNRILATLGPSVVPGVPTAHLTRWIGTLWRVSPPASDPLSS